MSQTPHVDAIIIGAGMGGLMTAALLGRQGRKVLVLEANERIGGFQRSVECEGFTIEPHFHFLQEAGPGRPVQKLFDAVGIAPSLVQLEPIAEFVFPDRRARVGNDRAAFASSLQQMFPAEAANIEALFAAMARIYQYMKEWPATAIQQLRSSSQPADPTQIPPSLAAILQYVDDTLDDYLSRFINDVPLKAILGGWATYFGYCGTQISALPVLVLSEACWDGGVHHPAGGIGSLSRALAQCIEHNGGIVRLSTRVERILVEDGRARGVTLADGQVLRASVVVSNADVLSTYTHLLDHAQAPGVRAQLLGLERFRAPFTVYAGVRSFDQALNGRAPVQVSFPNYDVEGQDRAQLEGRFDDLPVSIGIPSLVTPELAPPGHHLLKIYTFLAPSIVDRLQADGTYREDCARRMLKMAERALPGLRAALVMLRTSFDVAPDIYNDCTRGAIGWAPNLATMLCAPDQETSVAGLYLTGQWTNTGPAMNNVFRSSARVAELVAAAGR